MNEKQKRLDDRFNQIRAEHDAHHVSYSESALFDLRDYALGLLADSEPATVNTTALLSDLEASVSQEICRGVCYCGCTDAESLGKDVANEVKRIVAEHFREHK